MILKMAAANRAVSAEVVNEEEDGLWFSSEALFGELGGTYQAIPGMKSPSVFVPFSQVHFLIVDGR